MMTARERLNGVWIRAHIPHQGSMCLLEEVLSWDEQQLRCRAGSHRAPDHPLRAHGRLGSACLIEYAAQAVAVHGALLQGLHAGQLAGPVRPALLASARAVDLAVDRIDDILADLLIEAQRLHSDAHSALYAFMVHPIALQTLPHSDGAPAAVRQGRRLLARGRLSLWLNAGEAGPDAR
jgi:predicted hotdog family 3-hydroxylacyl-ACP dehydratase